MIFFQRFLLVGLDNKLYPDKEIKVSQYDLWNSSMMVIDHHKFVPRSTISRYHVI